MTSKREQFYKQRIAELEKQVAELRVAEPLGATVLPQRFHCRLERASGDLAPMDIQFKTGEFEAVGLLAGPLRCIQVWHVND